MSSPHRTSSFARCLLLALAACTDRRPPSDAAPDGQSADAAAADATDAAAPRSIAELPVAGAPVALSGLTGPVDVVVDNRGWPHIYARTLRDVALVQGFLMARDRMAEMDLVRRAASGTLAEAFGAVDGTLIDQDLAMRVIGLRRVAQAEWDALPATGRTRDALAGFADGVTEYLQRVRAHQEVVTLPSALVVTDQTPDWTPVDTLAIARLQAYVLSETFETEVAASQLHDAARTTFDGADPATSPALAARRGFFLDYHRFAPASTATALAPGAMGLVALPPPRDAPASPAAALAAARHFARLVAGATGLIGRARRGSNNWVLLGAATASGHALLANDPHLTLSSPPIWWGSHIVVTQGSDAVDAAGVSFAGVPGVTLGFNRHVAWGATVAEFDVTDAYLETVTPGVGGAPDSVLFEGRQVPIQVITESVADGAGGTVQARIEVVPHHGPIVPTIADGRIVPRTGTRAISVRWTGLAPTTEIDAFLGLMYAANIDDGIAALRAFGVGAQNFVLADTDGAVGYTTHAIVPVRAPGARSFDPARNPDGTLPCLVLPGDGGAEWTGTVDDAALPHAVGSPALPFIATANNDQLGYSLDDNPVNDPVYLACRWDFGWREERIQARLRALTPAQTTRAAMEAIQADHAVLAGGRFRPFLLRALARLEMERTSPGSQPDLSALATATAARAAALRDAARRLEAWTLDGASGVEDGATDASRADSVATRIFHAWLVRLLSDTFADEMTALGPDVAAGPLATDDVLRVTSALFLLEHPADARTRDAATGASAIWDDLGTAAVRESADAIMVRALDEALAQIARDAMTTDASQWLWGPVHTVQFASLIPGPGDALSIPPPRDAMFPRGFPRPGGIDVVDASDPGTSDFDFSFGEGASRRFTVEMDPAGPHGFDVLPGGQSMRLGSPHQRDDAELWRRNQSHPIPRTEAEVVASYESRLQFVPRM